MNKVIDFQKLSVVYPNGKEALEEVSFSISDGECLALVGESGCGKSTLARAALGILPSKTKVSGSIRIDESEVVGAPSSFLRRLRGLAIGFVAQDPFSAANPLFSVEDFIAEAWRVHSLAPAENEIAESLENLGIEKNREKIKKFPFEWSGGMMQRAAIAAASALSPKLIIADEPTSALDAELNKVVLKSLRKMKTAVLLISHDLTLVKEFADRIAVLENGKIVEIGSPEMIFREPQHSQTKRLLDGTTQLEEFRPERLECSEIALETKNLSHFYGQQRIIENLNLQLKTGEIIGICGASGCGKSTLLRLLMTIEMPRKGDIFFAEKQAVSVETNYFSSRIARSGFVMPVFQDSLASLDSRWAIWRIITEPLSNKFRKKRFSIKQKRKIAAEKLKEVGLGELSLDLRPGQLSGGQAQRIAIARALTAEAKVIVADEPTSSLDALNSRRIMQLFTETARKGVGIIIVSHDLSLLENHCHRIFTMKGGELKSKLL